MVGFFFLSLFFHVDRSQHWCSNLQWKNQFLSDLRPVKAAQPTGPDDCVELPHISNRHPLALCLWSPVQLHPDGAAAGGHNHLYLQHLSYHCYLIHHCARYMSWFSFLFFPPCLSFCLFFCCCCFCNSIIKDFFFDKKLVYLLKTGQAQKKKLDFAKHCRFFYFFYF